MYVRLLPLPNFSSTFVIWVTAIALAFSSATFARGSLVALDPFRGSAHHTSRYVGKLSLPTRA